LNVKLFLIIHEERSDEAISCFNFETEVSTPDGFEVNYCEEVRNDKRFLWVSIFNNKRAEIFLL